jgi:hypothetical protein
VTIAGLLSGEDILRTLDGASEGDLVLLPGEALNGDGVFIDGTPLGRVEEALSPARVRTGLELIEAIVPA